MENDMYKPEYVTEFEKDGYHIVHSHYTDRAEYEVYDNGRYVDVAESMAELSEITSAKQDLSQPEGMNQRQSGKGNIDRE